jgi:SAM-dependent methyltransferase
LAQWKLRCFEEKGGATIEIARNSTSNGWQAPGASWLAARSVDDYHRVWDAGRNIAEVLVVADVTSGLRSILSSPLVYQILQSVFGGKHERQKFVDRYVRPKPGDRIVDVGCGPGELLHFLSDVHYVGYDINPRYIAWAKRRHGSRGQFISSQFTEMESRKHGPFDIAIVVAVLHHLDDLEASKLFYLLRRCVRADGRIVTLDGVFVENQNPVARALIKWDRGQNVRTAERYKALAAPISNPCAARSSIRLLFHTLTGSWSAVEGAHRVKALATVVSVMYFLTRSAGPAGVKP